jgi:heme/copper-type cytochrome/quinol oxidase subunit 1
LNNDDVVDIHLHDTYFVIAHTHIFWLVAIVVLFIWVLYLLLNKTLYSKKLTWIHLGITILSILGFGFTFYFSNSILNQKPLKYYDFSNFESMELYDSSIKLLSLFMGIFLIGQIVFLLNFILGLIHLNSLKKN